MAIGVAAILGLAVSYLDWILGTVGSGLRISKGTSMIAPEYWIGLPCAALLGYLFPRNAIACAVAFMWVPVSIRHSAHILEHGVPNLWPLEIMAIAVLTLPYIGLAYAVAYLRRKNNVANVP
jgi:hypothetical protein